MVKLNAGFDAIHSKQYKPSIVANVRVYEASDECYKYRSDIALIFNQNRIANTIGVDNFQTWLAGFNTKRTGIDTSKYSDAQLLQFIKSRNIQAPSELLAWSDYLNNEAEAVTQEMTNLIKAEQEKAAAAAKAAQEKQAAQQQSVQSQIQVATQN